MSDESEERGERLAEELSETLKVIGALTNPVNLNSRSV